MKLPDDLEPNILQAEQLFARVMELIATFDRAVDSSDVSKVNDVINQINTITNHLVDREDLDEYWGHTSQEDLAFRLALPEPLGVTSVSPQDIIEIKKRIELLGECNREEEEKISQYLVDQKVNVAHVLIQHHYEPLLEIYDSSSRRVFYL